MNRDDLILVDTNVIIEAHRAKVLNELLGCLNLATVDMCIIETQTGAQNRDPKHHIDEALMRDKMTVYSPTDEDVLMAAMTYPGLAEVGDGERHLLAQASLLLDAGIWFLSSPDRHPMRLAIEYGWRDHLVSMEEVCRLANPNRKFHLRDNFTEAWHQHVCAQFMLNVRR